MKPEKIKSPYLDARRTHNDRVVQILTSAKIMNLYGAFGLLITAIAVAGVVYMGSLSKFVPIVYETDKYHNILSAVRGDQIQAPKPIDFEVACATFISGLRVVTSDFDLQKQSSIRMFGFVKSNDPARQKIVELLGGPSDERNPFNRAANENVSISDLTVIKQSETSYQVDWTEKVRIPKTGELKSNPYRMRALVQVYQDKEPVIGSESDDVLLNNPHRIFIKDFNLDKQK